MIFQWLYEIYTEKNINICTFINLEKVHVKNAIFLKSKIEACEDECEQAIEPFILKVP